MGLLDWFVEHHPEQAVRAGSAVFLAPAIARLVIDRAEAAGVAVTSMRGFDIDDRTAVPVPGQVLAPQRDSLLDCETPSGASCGAARRALAGRWVGHEPAAGRRHMVIIELDDRPPESDEAARWQP